jgi:hypothetical protein
MPGAHWHRRGEKHVAGSEGPVPGGHESVPPVHRRQVVPQRAQSRLIDPGPGASAAKVSMENSSWVRCPCPVSAGSGNRSSTITPSLFSSTANASVRPGFLRRPRREARPVSGMRPGQLHRPGLSPRHRRDFRVVAIAAADHLQHQPQIRHRAGRRPGRAEHRNLRTESMSVVPVKGSCSTQIPKNRVSRT